MKLTINDSYKLDYAGFDIDSRRIRCKEEEGTMYVSLETSKKKSSGSESKSKSAESKTCQNCVICCYAAILKYNLFQGAYSTLALAYQYLLSLPISQVHCERSFSILKFIKNRLRSTLSDNRLEFYADVY